MQQKKSQTLAQRIIEEIDFVPHDAKQSRHEELLYVFKNNNAVVKHDHQRKESDQEICFPNPQSSAWLVVLPDQS